MIFFVIHFQIKSNLNELSNRFDKKQLEEKSVRLENRKKDVI